MITEKVPFFVSMAIIFFYSIRVFFTDTDDSQDRRGREGTIFYCTLSFPSANKHWDIYLQRCMWDDYHIFLIAALVFTRLLLAEIYHLIDLPFEWLIDDAIFVCLLDELIIGFCYSDLTLETGGFEIALTITLVLLTLVLQTHGLTKCASHPMAIIVRGTNSFKTNMQLHLNPNYAWKNGVKQIRLLKKNCYKGVSSIALLST